MRDSPGGSTVLWFRRDLRLADHPALVEAVAAAEESFGVVGLFVIDPRLWEPAGDNRRAFLIGCLRALDESMGGRLVIRYGDPAEVVSAVAAEVGAREVFVSADHGPYGSARDSAVEAALEASEASGAGLARIGSPYAVDPGSVKTKTGGAYKVFTPFSKAWRAHGWPDPIESPAEVRWATLPSEPLPDAPTTSAALPEPGESAAIGALERFLADAADDYDEARDRPGVEGTSRLSPYLKWGCIHPRQVLARLGTGDGHKTFRSELCWREFYADVLHHWPDTARQAFKPQMKAMERDDPGDVFDHWCQGTTGFPIVDAGMRQLLAEGWMHNRVRMLTASFLVKDLHLDWTLGARWFMRHLVDGDLASNQHGWQWVAGIGTDASPFFRIFNPVTQGERFDPDGAYVRRWIPELGAIDRRFVHQPWNDPSGQPAGYPAPIIDHAEEREEALRRYAAVRAVPAG